MSMQALELNADDRAVYKAWRRNIIVLWSTILGVTAIVCAVTAVDSTSAPQQRIEMALQAFRAINLTPYRTFRPLPDTEMNR